MSHRQAMFRTIYVYNILGNQSLTKLLEGCYLIVIQMHVATYNTGKVPYLTILDVFTDIMAYVVFCVLAQLLCVSPLRVFCLH
jgi:hypothetical protein